MPVASGYPLPTMPYRLRYRAAEIAQCALLNKLRLGNCIGVGLFIIGAIVCGCVSYARLH